MTLKDKINELGNLVTEAKIIYNAAMDETLAEEEQDNYYEDYHKLMEHIAEKLMDLIEIDSFTARRMAYHKQDEIKALVARLA